MSAADGGTGTYGYSLITDYSRVFLPAYKNGAEHIFSAQMKGNSYSQGNAETSRAIFSAIPGLPGNYAHMVRFYTEGNDKFFNIYKLFKATDKRRDVTFVRNFTSPANGRKYGLAIVNAAVPNDSTPFWNKWWDPNNLAVTTNSEANVPIIRYAELLLIHAEAENEVNGPSAKAYRSINKVRTRAGLADLTTGLSKDQFRDSVYFERRLELTYEYQRWFDLIREKDASGNGILIKSLQKVGKNNVAEKHYLYPIPQTEIDNNPLLKQNTLWE